MVACGNLSDESKRKLSCVMFTLTYTFYSVSVVIMLKLEMLQVKRSSSVELVCSNIFLSPLFSDRIVTYLFSHNLYGIDLLLVYYFLFYK